MSPSLSPSFPLSGLLLLTACAFWPLEAAANAVDSVLPPNAPRSEFKDDIGFGKDPFFPRSTRRPKVVVKAAETAPPRSTVPDSVILKGISVIKDKKLAIINNYTLGEGEEFTLKGGAQPVKVKCVEIKEKSVIVSVGGATKELPLRAVSNSINLSLPDLPKSQNTTPMNKKLTAVLLGLATSGLVSLAQDNNPPPTPPPVDNVNPAESAPAAPAPATPAVEAPAPTPAPAPTDGALPVAARENNAPADTNAPPAAAKPDEAVPLIVIDDVPLTDAIRNLARQSNINFQFDPRVTSSNQPNVSIRFENVSAQEALSAVLDNYNLAMIKEPKSKIARIAVKDPKAEDPLVSRIVQLKYADPSNLVHVVKVTLSPRSTVTPDNRTSQLIINTTEKEVDNVLSLIDKLDTATKQVLIEAKLIETSKNPSTIKGIDWSGTLSAQKFSFGNNLKDQDPTISRNDTLATSAPKMLLDTAKGFNPATAFLDADGVSAVLSFLNKDSDTEVVATPRAVTLDNQQATLAVTKAVPIFQITPGSANSPAGATITYTNLGVILNVTPRIAADNNISLRVIPEVSNIDSQDEQFIDGKVNTANIYAIRRIDTSVMIPSSHTLVMGGLVNDRKVKEWTKVPILGDIPFAGLAFRKESKSRNKQNLLIFITPTIVDDGDFHASTGGRVFLQSRATETPEPKDNAWDSAKPYDWSKPSH